MAADLKILITATDQASSVIKDVNHSLGGMDDAAGKASGGLGKLGGVLKGGVAIGATAAVAGIGALAAVIGSSIGDAMKAQEVTAQLEAVIKSTGGVAGMTADEINNLGLELSKVTRFEDDAIVKSSALLLTFTKVGEDVFPQAQEAILNVAQAMGTDLQSATMMVGKALNDPLKGMAAMSRAGIQFTEEQKATVKALVESGDTAKAQAIILKELEVQFGNSARAAGQTLPGQLDILKNQIGNVKEQIGGAFIPILTDLAVKLGPVLIEAAQGLADFIVNQLVPALSTAGQWFEANLLPAIQAVGGWIQANLVPILQVVWTWLATNLPPAIQALSQFWTNTLQPALQVVWQFFQDKIVPILKVVIEVWFKALKLELQILAAFWENVLLPAIKAVWNFLQTYIIPIVSDLVSIWFASLKITLGELSDLWQQTLLPAIRSVWSFIQDNILPIFQELIDKLEGPVAAAFEFIRGVIEGVTGAFQTLFGWIRDVIDAAADAMNAVSGIPGTGRRPATGISGAGRAPVRVAAGGGGGGRSMSIVITGNSFGGKSDIDYMLNQLDRKLRLQGGILPL